MSKIISIILYLCIFAGGVAVAILYANENAIVMWIGIAIAVFTLLTGLLTTRDIEKLKKKSKKAVYVGETIGVVPDVNLDFMKQQIRKDYPDLNP